MPPGAACWADVPPTFMVEIEACSEVVAEPRRRKRVVGARRGAGCDRATRAVGPLHATRRSRAGYQQPENRQEREGEPQE